MSRYETRPQRRRQRGQNLVEFALVLPVLLLVAIWLITIPGFAFFDLLVAFHVVNQAAQDGANAAALGGDTAACTVAQAEAGQQFRQIGLQVDHAQVTCQVQDVDPNAASSYGAEGVRAVVVTLAATERVLLLGPVTIALPAISGSARIERETGP